MLGETYQEEGLLEDANKSYNKCIELLSYWFGDDHVDLILLRMMMIINLSEYNSK